MIDVAMACGQLFIRDEKQHKYELFGPNRLRAFLTLTLGRAGVKSFSPHPGPGPQDNIRFGADVCGRPWPEGFSENFVQKKFALIF